MIRDYFVPAIVFVIFAVLGGAYIYWLDSGCELSGAMTWEGKVCFNDLTK